jgi:hypothetical protein
MGNFGSEREYATTLELCNDTPNLPVVSQHPQPPLDGKTLKPSHFNRIWQIYGLQGTAFPYVTWEASLQKLALLRNDIAHGNIPFMEIFQQAGTTVAEIERYIEDVGYFSIHLIEEWASYLRTEGYLAR